MIDWIAIIIGFTAGLLAGGLVVYFLLSGRNQKNKNELIRLKTMEEARQQADEAMVAKFENLATKIVATGSQKLSEDNHTQLGHLLQPLRDKIADFEKKVEDVYDREARERFNLQKEIEKLASLNLQMSDEARNLTRALQGDNKLQGNWGEMVLARILENSGLREGEEFVLQGKNMKLLSAEGKRLQPDVIVNLPDEKHIIVDSKVSLTAYERFVGSEEKEKQNLALRQHIDSVRTHINQLSEKHYPGINGLQAPDFVLLFMPVEPAFAVAVQHQADLFSYAWDRKIVLVSPTTLLATLRTVASIWKLEHQNKNALEIARQGGTLYDKFVGFVEEMQKIGKNLERASQAYSDAMNKLVSGHGNLANRAEKLRELGVKTSRKL